jgi:hypothetical protein
MFAHRAPRSVVVLCRHASFFYQTVPVYRAGVVNATMIKDISSNPAGAVLITYSHAFPIR